MGDYGDPMRRRLNPLRTTELVFSSHRLISGSGVIPEIIRIAVGLRL